MKLYDKKEILPIVMIVMIAMVGAYLYPQLPDLVPSHWGINGEINGWMNKSFAVYFFPGLILVVYMLMSFLPLMDPMKKNIELFSHLYFWFKIAFVAFMSSLFLMMLYAGLGYEINVGRYVMRGIAFLFFFIGLMTPQIKKNYTIGIRLPWTLHSEVVWKRTHQFGGRLFITLSILIAFASFLSGNYAFYILLGGTLLLLAVLIGYSYTEYRKIGEK